MTPEQTARSTDQIAAVIRSEIAHFTERHILATIARYVDGEQYEDVAANGVVHDLVSTLAGYVIYGGQPHFAVGSVPAPDAPLHVGCYRFRVEALARLTERLADEVAPVLPDGCVKAHGDHDPACSLHCWILAKRDLARQGIHKADVAEALDIADATGADGAHKAPICEAGSVYDEGDPKRCTKPATLRSKDGPPIVHACAECARQLMPDVTLESIEVAS